MIVLIDNYDSFTYNLYQLIGAIEPDLRVVRNDACTVESLAAMQPDALVLSPGPGRPENAGICTDAIRYFSIKSRFLAFVWDIRPYVRRSAQRSPMPRS